MSAYTNNGVNSRAGMRPLSASTKKSELKKLGLEKKGRGFGYFGDDNDRIKEHEEKQKYENGLKVQEMTKATDEEGKVIFKDLPVGKYMIEVEGNAEYQS